MMTAASCAATRRNISSLPSRPVRFRTFAPASRQARATAGRYVSTDTTMPVARSASITGSSMEFCPASSARAAWAKVDSAPRSTMPAPCACKTFARRTAVSPVRQTLSRYQESVEKLITPMIAGRALKGKSSPPRANSLTWAAAASRCFSSNSDKSSSLSIRKSSRSSHRLLFNLSFRSHFRPAGARTPAKMVRSARIERATDCLEGSCSIHLSYERNQLNDTTCVFNPHARLAFCDRRQQGTAWPRHAESVRSVPLRGILRAPPHLGQVFGSHCVRRLVDALKARRATRRRGRCRRLCVFESCRAFVRLQFPQAEVAHPAAGRRGDLQPAADRDHWFERR